MRLTKSPAAVTNLSIFASLPVQLAGVAEAGQSSQGAFLQPQPGLISPNDRERGLWGGGAGLGASELGEEGEASQRRHRQQQPPVEPRRHPRLGTASKRRRWYGKSRRLLTGVCLGR